jgi:spermidine/putrescine-binding protein
LKKPKKYLGEKMEEIYQEFIIELYKNPRNFGKIENPQLHAQLHNSTCGDQIELFIKIKENKIDEVKFIGRGCAISQASASLFTGFLKGKKVAVYGWHGEIAQAAKENPNIQLVVPQNHPVIGVDYVCIPKNRAHPKLSKEQLVKFVELLTDPESTHWGVESTQYFSPYKNDLQGLSPAVVKLYQNLMSVMAQSPPFVLTAPDKDEHQLINNWWRGVRYESKK